MRYTKVRNFLAENLAEKMEMLMKEFASNNNNNDDDDDDLKSICSDGSIPWNTFKCWIGKCGFYGPTDEIRQHYQDSHAGLYVKVIFHDF